MVRKYHNNNNTLNTNPRYCEEEPQILKMAAGVLAPSITALINKSIDSSCFPSQLKIAKIFPIHKSGPKSDPSNYRPNNL